MNNVWKKILLITVCLLVITVFSFCFRITQSSVALMVSIFSCTLSHCLMRCWTSSGPLLDRLFSCSRARPSCQQSTQVVIYTQKIKIELLIKDQHWIQVQKHHFWQFLFHVLYIITCIINVMCFSGLIIQFKKNWKTQPFHSLQSNFQMGRLSTSNHPKWQYVKML